VKKCELAVGRSLARRPRYGPTGIACPPRAQPRQRRPPSPLRRIVLRPYHHTHSVTARQASARAREQRRGRSEQSSSAAATGPHPGAARPGCLKKSQLLTLRSRAAAFAAVGDQQADARATPPALPAAPAATAMPAGAAA